MTVYSLEDFVYELADSEDLETVYARGLVGELLLTTPGDDSPEEE